MTWKEFCITFRITIDGVNYHLQKLDEEGRILRIGSSKSGYWKVVQ